MADKYDYDVLYIGAGHGTFDGAIPLAQKGFKIAVVEADKVGGTCPNWGCNAKIALDIPVQLTETQKRLQNIINGDTSINWKENMANKHKVIDGLPDAISGLIESLNIKLIHGFAKLSDNHTVTVGDNSYSADKIVIATGLRPHRLDVEGKELAHDSKDFLNLDEMPKHVTVIGAGYIAMEFATIANAAGAQVTVLMHGDKALRQFNQEYVDMVMKDLEDKGVRFIKNADIKGFVQKDDCVTAVQLADEDVRTDYILDATGRIPNVENIGLDELGIKYDNKGIKVNDHLATDVDNIYASGDVADTGQPKLTPTAMFESKYLTSLFSGETKDAIDFPAIPSVVFTTPRIAEVGVSVDEAKDSDEYTVEETDMTKDWYRAITKEQIAKRAYVFDKEHHLVGATEVSDQADSVIDSILPAVALKLDQKQIGRLVHLFPSIGSDAWQSI
ncbi:dihydrolipoyl dehydrogenase family protein [Apilactobacillus micheneri]|uniref:NAD(P)/FAD-dependent oxidoreductase n=1 Tax=Apilactobacillus micheneri TaxID=1899430 RepID=A0A9Q8MTW0_9LACO|nr:NAD(P)/FAD-dependent oxidoreductase [Apilactobacillus micheneri]TPR40099.1 NAD(P)/FAD-dependent oxidoreductase [Apilactobacillus micheneri]TPR41910.1 NAD(P)/FAD-dependent oxidoreductase [Apilactobacillus micheneri]TPR44301.1 NAD(P)/FAD-dependent oxidoreductase [Apilactobacillus micheneri]TPR45925.1 NAD(P)/FAD-dependent oxidoreductase [Apilactobacillus micheneri]TPR51685.1 NAD(P)/FAD-dependent oxidoreductase [Apilactobacillus micheneri]